ncbi:hypothetical protein L6452_01775 [Arctium lappa]|uniref:Uncharacterized protein n=1 Tax=Arctium lappa TaxID=4217 RepID=A0ACB9FH18_ARCLA|nr:hypothetical protein L6452_01775 [Arctium lappa]
MAEEISHDPIVQMDENDPNISKEAPMPSSRSHVQSAAGVDPDHALIHPSEYLFSYPNNDHVDFDVLTVNPLVVEILKGHPLNQALTYTASIPMIYLQQAWKTVEYVVESEKVKYFNILIDNFT